MELRQKHLAPLPEHEASLSATEARKYLRYAEERPEALLHFFLLRDALSHCRAALDSSGDLGLLQTAAARVEQLQAGTVELSTPRQVRQRPHQLRALLVAGPVR